MTRLRVVVDFKWVAGITASDLKKLDQLKLVKHYEKNITEKMSNMSIQTIVLHFCSSGIKLALKGPTTEGQILFPKQVAKYCYLWY